jgi:hypothetical protein
MDENCDRVEENDDTDTSHDSTFWVHIVKFINWIVSDEAIPYVDTIIFVLSIIFLLFTVDNCVLCVFGLLIVSLLLCCRLRFMFIILWSCIIVLWIHGWRFGGGKGLSLQWN